MQIPKKYYKGWKKAKEMKPYNPTFQEALWHMIENIDLQIKLNSITRQSF